MAVVAIFLMLVSIALSILPVIPGPALVWAIGVVFGALTGFERLTVFAAAIMTVLMAAGSTSGWWMQALGMRAQGGSCLSIVGALVGGLVGTFVLPIPILGTLVGAVVGAVVFELARIGDPREALRTGGVAVVSYVMTLGAEILFSILIMIVFLASVLLAG